MKSIYISGPMPTLFDIDLTAHGVPCFNQE